MRHPIYLLRHGQTEWNVAGRMQGGEGDSPLTPAGQRQAQAMADALAHQGVTADSHIFLTSPQGRARQTAAAITARIGADFLPDPRLREMDMAGMSGLTHHEIEARWPGSHDEQHPYLWYDTAPGAEGFSALRARVVPVLAGLDRPAVIVTHGLVSMMIRAEWQGLDIPPALTTLPGGQGVIWHLTGAGVAVIAPKGGVQRAPVPRLT